MKKILSLVVLAAGLAWLTGCESPESRIRQNPDLYSHLTPDQQQAIREGRVGVGFTPEMVKLALGDPDRVRIRTDANGRSEVWHYITYEGADGTILYSGWYHRGWRDPYHPYYVDVVARRPHSRESVVFRDGHVVSIEQDKS
jgi:hypothetical protein